MDITKKYGLFGLYDTANYCFNMACEIAKNENPNFHPSDFWKGKVKNANAIAFMNCEIRITNHLNNWKTPLIKNSK